jgi:hypothetical protein
VRACAVAIVAIVQWYSSVDSKVKCTSAKAKAGKKNKASRAKTKK